MTCATTLGEPLAGEGQLLGLVISIVLVLGGAFGMWALLKRADWI